MSSRFAVDPQLVNRLLALNRAFYARSAKTFSDTRPAARVNLEPLKPYLASDTKVLDVGCGNGRLAAQLDCADYRLHYVGIDVTPELIAIARARNLRRVTAEFRVADVTVPGWGASLHDRAPFDVILMMAVLHHIPSFALRRAVLSDLRTLLRADGIVVMSNWQFMRDARLRRKLVPWSMLDVDERELETGDALLDWKRGGTGYRYCHCFTAAEVSDLAAQSGFVVRAQFYADGELNLYSVLQPIA